jgi:2-dehydro-3-deoxygalactonokinase
LIELNSSQAEWVIVDWGTTNFRAFLMTADNQCLDRIESKTGLLKIENQQFEQTLANNLSAWDIVNNKYPVFMAGMVGSKQGWQEAPYISTPLSLSELSDSCLRFETQWGSTINIIPGVSHQVDSNKLDVMRGEEVQILGLVQLGYQQDSMVILPGTHSKHAILEQGKLVSFSTFMTGEFYSLLSEHSILGRNLSTQIQSEEAFVKGVQEGAKGNLMNTAFMARTHRLFEHLKESEVHDYLSGLVIGKEVNDISATSYVISNSDLAARYSLACNQLNKSNQTIDGELCFVSGMVAIRKQVLCQTM